MLHGRLPHWFDDQLDDEDGQHGRGSNACLVFAVLPVARGRVGTLVAAVWGEPRQHARHVAGIVVVVGECLTQVTLFAGYDRNINHGEHQEHDRDDPPTEGRDGESGGKHERAEVQRIARVGIGAAGGELLVFLHMAGCQPAQDETGKQHQGARDERSSRWSRQPDVDNRENKSQGYADATGHSRPGVAGGW